MDLQLIFDRHMDRVVRSPHVCWGKDDCCLWVADIVKDVCGIDLAEPFRGKYRTSNGAARTLEQYAGGGLVKAAVKRAAELHLKEIDAPGQQRLAVSVCANKAGPLLAVWNGFGWLVRTEHGCASLPVHWMVICWELPECRPQ